MLSRVELETKFYNLGASVYPDAFSLDFKACLHRLCNLFATGSRLGKKN